MTNGLRLGIFLLPLAFMLHGCAFLDGLMGALDAFSQSLPCPEWVGTNTTPICPQDGLSFVGACFNH
eukprot:CAMPEP_0172859554 /NCGR_PEP_ID=MMETSP1075-20121228/70408_1 /TAXON_ID=2916 /ORGANISM="Ceratium fusus, Strain PA161109" /LENGTH=66 /DNA_ID=CAMNT_0013707387 /DNA_START=64 /DNA_END=261 /DNA_ORIENTATION=+